MGKLFFAILIFFTQVIYAADGEDCAPLLQNQTAIVALKGPGEPPRPALVGAYSKNVGANPITEDQKKMAHPLFDLDPLNPRKLEFISQRAELLESMIKNRQFNLGELRQARVFDGEIYVNGKYQPYGYIVIMPSRIFVFGYNDLSVNELKGKSYGFLAHNVKSLRLDKQLVATFTEGIVEVDKAEIKDPENLNKLAEKTPADSDLAKLIKEHSAELSEMLLNTTFDLEILAQSHVQKGTVRGSNETVYMIGHVQSARIFYVSKKPGVLNPSNSKSYGMLNGQSRVGFVQDYERHVHLSSGDVARIENNRLIIDLASNPKMAKLFLARMALNSPAEGRDFMAKNQTALMDLVKEGLISPDLKELRQFVSVKNAVSEESFDVIFSDKGFIAVDERLPKKWAFLRDLDSSWPAVWNAPNDTAFVIRQSIGFNPQIVEEIHGPEEDNCPNCSAAH